MAILTTILISLVAILHIYFMVLEMFLWDKPYGMRAFGHNKNTASITKTLAMNQGLYNGFLAAGLIWGLSIGDSGFNIKLFFLLCVVIAGIFGGLTASKKILLFQALPAILALTLLFLF
jgi:putative membrane protein